VFPHLSCLKPSPIKHLRHKGSMIGAEEASKAVLLVSRVGRASTYLDTVFPCLHFAYCDDIAKC